MGDYEDIENVLQSHVENVDYFLNLIKKRIQTLHQNKIIILQIDELNNKYNNNNQSNTKQIFSDCFNDNDQIRNEKIMKGRGSIDFEKEMDCMKRENNNRRNSINTRNQPKNKIMTKMSDVSIEHGEQQKSETAENIQEQNTNQEIVEETKMDNNNNDNDGVELTTIEVIEQSISIQEKEKRETAKKKHHVDLNNVSLKSHNQTNGMLIISNEESSSSMEFGDNSLNSLSHSIINNTTICSEDDDEHRLNKLGPLLSHNTDITGTSDSNEKITNVQTLIE